MAQYFNASGLRQLAQSESGGRAGLIHYPTGYTKDGTPSSASGLYGFLDRTWQSYAANVPGASQYARAYQAPADVQTAVAAQTPIGHWVCKGCNSTAVDIAADPANLTGTPANDLGGVTPFRFDPYAGNTFVDALPENPLGADIVATQTPSVASQSDYQSMLDRNFPGGLLNDFGASGEYGAGQGGISGDAIVSGITDLIGIGKQAQKITGKDALGSPTGGTWWSEFFAIIGSFFQRSGVALLGIILIGIGIWALARKA